ncbi:MAG TPA: FAD-binding oxidoreductase [Bacteroidia bacterium]|nr:FAD-binding oxidoreductase [Bacteroidia bacterium]
MARFHLLRVKDIRRETSDAVSIEFEVPPQRIPEYQFKMGQYVTLKLKVDGEDIRRSYSICAAPHEKTLRVAVKEVPSGKASLFLNKTLKVGDFVDVMTPMGSFNTVLTGSSKKNYLLFAGGSGITPMMSIIKSVLYVEKQSQIQLIYANRNKESSIFRTEIENLAAAHPNLKVLFVYDQAVEGWPELQTGIISVDKAKALINAAQAEKADEYFICGPGPLMENARLALESLGVKKEKIHIEYFTSVADAVNKAEQASNTNVNAHIKVIQYGVETEFELETSGISVLEAAIEAGVDAPFSCKGAVCCTCRAKVLEGKVKMNANFALTDQEVAEGYVLTCQSHPLTETVVIDYDA